MLRDKQAPTATQPKPCQPFLEWSYDRIGERWTLADHLKLRDHLAQVDKLATDLVAKVRGVNEQSGYT